MPANALNFDFLAAKSFGGGGDAGGVVLADNTIFPGVVGNGMSMLVGFLGPCGMVAPHNHPRATEYLINVAGPPLSAGSFNENGAPYYQGDLYPGTVTVLPLGSVHYVSNEGCDPALIIAGFNSETPGVGFLSSIYTSFDRETVSAAFGVDNAEVYDASKIPNAVNLGHQQCLQKCGIDRSTYNIQNQNVTNHDLMKMAFAGYLKQQNYDYDTDVWKTWAN